MEFHRKEGEGVTAGHKHTDGHASIFDDLFMHFDVRKVRTPDWWWDEVVRFHVTVGRNSQA